MLTFLLEIRSIRSTLNFKLLPLFLPKMSVLCKHGPCSFQIFLMHAPVKCYNAYQTQRGVARQRKVMGGSGTSTEPQRNISVSKMLENPF